VTRSLVKDVIFASHSGHKRAFETIYLRYWWQGIRDDVNNWVKQCDGCLRRKQRHEYWAPMSKVRVLSFLFEITRAGLIVEPDLEIEFW